MDYKKILQDTIHDNNYLCLSTVCSDGKPWSSPLVYDTDEEMNIYFISHTHALHSENIEKYPYVALSIYSSIQRLGNAFGVQASGKAYRIEAGEVPHDIQRNLYDKTSLVVLAREHSFYKIEVDAAYLPDEERWKTQSPLRTRVDNL